MTLSLSKGHIPPLTQLWGNWSDRRVQLGSGGREPWRKPEGATHRFSLFFKSGGQFIKSYRKGDEHDSY
jgi:hypothetical protein